MEIDIHIVANQNLLESKLEKSSNTVDQELNSTQNEDSNLLSDKMDVELETNNNTENGEMNSCDLNDGNYSVEMTHNADENLLSIENIQSGTDDLSRRAHTNFPSTEFQELSRISWPNDAENQHYTRGCIWSPDGTCILTAINLDGMHVIEVPSDLYTAKEISCERSLDVLTSAVVVKEGGTVYDYCWYPMMRSTMPDSCLWAASRQHEPIQLWDAFTSELRCSYRGYDAVDEVEAAIAIAFSPDGEKLIGGYKKSLKIFATSLPGRDYREIPIRPSCSTIAMHPQHNEMLATGSWSRSINLYDLRSPQLGSLASLTGHKGGVTLVKFSPDGEILISGARKDKNLLLWDMRNYSKPMITLTRNVSTNQRIYFDISNDSKWLCSGDTNGMVRLWSFDDEKRINKEYQLPLHYDCCNGVGIHPYLPILCTTSGQYHFINADQSTDGEQIRTYENSLIFWWFGEKIP